MGHPRPPFLLIFGLFKQTIQFLQQINVNKCPFSIRCWVMNPQPLKHESSHLTARPGPLHFINFFVISHADDHHILLCFYLDKYLSFRHWSNSERC